MDTNTEILHDFAPFFRILKNGSIQRLVGTEFVPAGQDTTTGVTSKDVTIDPNCNLSVRLFLPPNPSKSEKLPILIYFHGGAFILESAFSPAYHAYVGSLASNCNVLAVSVDYRLAPEHCVPAAYDDSLAAIQWVLSCKDDWLAEFGDFNQIFMAGDSAGGNIAHNMALREIGTKIERLILFHPWFGGSEPKVTDEGHMKSRFVTNMLWKYACPASDGVDDPRINPMAQDAPSLTGLNCKRLLVCWAGKDGLKEWQKAYYEAVKNSGYQGEVEMCESEGEEHCFHITTPGREKAKELMDLVASFFSKN
ncbi:hypothetical protein LUZ63_000404 [Rhynchospora breviuscula]|uniref:Alpha/beta hydrolase fold-3 domain-containing protein n=1 Tax=Rhynchospora breviuscula TaxID=2022672 RepID=A0A9Q0CVG7_9POAL|nr:hypothetical protein LUZ63_000404 [Rhynchospora breviuscula]